MSPVYPVCYTNIISYMWNNGKHEHQVIQGKHVSQLTVLDSCTRWHLMTALTFRVGRAIKEGEGPLPSKKVWSSK